jgi:hypothetical protein
MLLNQTVGRVSGWWSSLLITSRMMGDVRGDRPEVDGLIPSRRGYRRVGRGADAMVFVGLCREAAQSLSVNRDKRRRRPPYM